MKTRFRELKDLGLSRLFFANTFEEIWAISIAINLIRSSFLNEIGEKLGELCVAILGRKNVLTLLKRISSVHATELSRSRWNRTGLSLDELPEGIFAALMETQILPQLEARRSRLLNDEDQITVRRLANLVNDFGLSSLERDVVSYFFVKQACRPLESLLERFDSINKFRAHGQLLIGCESAALMEVFTDCNLLKQGVLEISSSRNEFRLSGWAFGYLQGVGPDNLSNGLFCVYEDELLQLEDFKISYGEIDIVRKLLVNAEPCNILLYGKPGTGKTSFARTIAKACGLPLYEVNIPATDSLSERMSAVLATIAVAEKRKAIVLIDEADDILNTVTMFRYGTTSKAWINTLLESHEAHLVIVTNRIDCIEMSTRRRFDFSIEFCAFTQLARKSVLTRELDRAGLRSTVSEADIDAISRSYQVNADGMSNAVSVLKRLGVIEPTAASETIKRVLTSQERIYGRPFIASAKNDAPFSVDLLNTSVNPGELITHLRRYRSQEPEQRKPIPILFYGVPGTGKTAFALHLGKLLDQEVSLKRCSDLISKYVGESEQNIAAAFRECHDNDSILFFDEADSFLFPREEAHHSWERTMTNEMLACMDSYPGIVVFATNAKDYLDRAAIRRFRYKVGFYHLDNIGCIRCYDLLLSPLAEEGDHGYQAVVEELSGLVSATLGDFATVREQFLYSELVSHRDLITALKAELKHKEKSWKRIGF